MYRFLSLLVSDAVLVSGQLYGNIVRKHWYIVNFSISTIVNLPSSCLVSCSWISTTLVLELDLVAVDPSHDN